MYQCFDLLHAVCEGRKVVDVHEGDLGAYIVSELIESGFIGNIVVGCGYFLQDSDGFAGGGLVSTQSWSPRWTM